MCIPTITSHRLKATLIAIGIVLSMRQGLPGDTPKSPAPSEQNATEAKTLRFSFDRAQWRSVLSWVADEAKMALYISELPTGTFTYSDPNFFTPDETIDRINLFLIAEGYTFVRSGKLLSLISLGDPQSMRQLDAMADLVSLDELENRGGYEVVKCIFPLGKVDSSTALSELSALSLITQPIVLAGTNQLLITDTAGKLRTAKQILDSLDSTDRNTELVRSFVLKHATADEVLAVARPHLGIEADEMSGFDVSLSADTKGQKLFATGSKQSIDLLDSLVSVIDRPDEKELKERVLQSHPVSGENLRSVYDVLQTLLADQSIRLSEDDESNSIVALAPLEVHENIKRTIEELDGPGFEFAVIELNTLNPYAAMTLLNELFGVEESKEEETQWWDRRRRSRFEDNEKKDDAPKIHADLQKKRLLVRGRPAQIEEIKRVIASLDASPEGPENVRIIPSFGSQSEEILDLARKFWRGDNPVLVIPTGSGQQTNPRERTTHPDKPTSSAPRTIRADEASGDSASDSNSTSAWSTINTQLLSNDDFSLGLNARSSGDHSSDPGNPIRIQFSSGGIILQSDDTEALDQFEDHLRMISRLGGATESAEPMVFYLKYATANEATRMLADLLDGARWLTSSSGGFLDGTDSSSTDGSYWGSLLMSRDGTTTMTAGSATVVSDARLNRLIVQGTPEDIALIEGYLKVVDKDSSITSIETRGRSHVIELRHTKAAEVATVIREAYGDRIADTQQQNVQRDAKRAGNKNNDDEEERQQDNEDEPRRPAAPPTRNRETKMTLAVHDASNSLIITAPDQLFFEVERLARSLDQRAEQAMEIVVPGKLSGRYVEAVLQNALLPYRTQEPTVEPVKPPAETAPPKQGRERE